PDHGPVERTVQGRGVAGLEARRVDEHELRGSDRADAGDSMPRRLRLARGDADFLAHQRVQQRRLAHVGLADDRYCPAALRCRVHHFPLALSASSIAAAAACSPARRDAPIPRSTTCSSAISHSTSNVCLWAAPSVAATRYTGSFIRRPCSHSCSSVFGSLAVAAMLGLISTSLNKRRTSASAAT